METTVGAVESAVHSAVGDCHCPSVRIGYGRRIEGRCHPENRNSKSLANADNINLRNRNTTSNRPYRERQMNVDGFVDVLVWIARLLPLFGGVLIVMIIRRVLRRQQET